MRLALTLGDPRGIGPEVMGEAGRRFRLERPEVELLGLGSTRGLPADFPLPVEEVDGHGGEETDLDAGRISVAALRRGVELCLTGDAQGLVTGPVHKPSLHAAGVLHPGQTEFLGELAGVSHTGMLMASERSRLGPPLRILLATTHLPLKEVSEALTAPHLAQQIRLLDRSLREGWGLPEPRIALCGMNPHASDGGLFGSEEAEVMAPVVSTLQGEDILVEGPFPADTVFLRHLDGRADAVVVPYHDVGMAVFKTLAFGAGVNVTLGLPFIRTSPDHGTAFDLAGRGTADPGSALHALRLAARVASVSLAREGNI